MYKLNRKLDIRYILISLSTLTPPPLLNRLLSKAATNILHLGRLADVQTLRHGLPPEATDAVSRDCGLSPRDELLQVFAYNVTAHYMKPPGGSVAATSIGARTTTTTSTITSAAAPDIETIQHTVPITSSSLSTSAAISASSVSASTAAAAAAGILPPPPLAPTSSSLRRFTVEEDVSFKQGIVLYGLKKPAQIALHMGTRTAEQVREKLRGEKKKAAASALMTAPLAAPAQEEEKNTNVDKE
jgi:hypothetical protein